MSAHGGSKAILAAFIANMGIAVAKFIGWLLSGSASMLAEAVHSVADSSNQVLLFIGGRVAKREADREHPFGYGRERYVYAFVVGIILFSVGGLFSVYEGINKLTHPHALSEKWWWLPIVILTFGIILEGFSLRTAIKEANEVRDRGQSWWHFIRHSRSPELPVLLLEDTAAMLGLVFALAGVTASVASGDPTYDAIGTLAIGVLLIGVAVVIGIEMKSLLVGEGATKAQLETIIAAIEHDKDAPKVIHIKTLYLGPEELLVAAKIGLQEEKTLGATARDIDEIEARIRRSAPEARVIYLEPDVFREVSGDKPSTEAFVFPSSD